METPQNDRYVQCDNKEEILFLIAGYEYKYIPHTDYPFASATAMFQNKT